jgi:hypothetical protein
MFIVSKEIMKYIAKLGLSWEKSMKEEEPIDSLALSVLLLYLAIPMIIVVISVFVFDIILSPLEALIVWKKRRINERNK